MTIVRCSFPKAIPSVIFAYKNIKARLSKNEYFPKYFISEILNRDNILK